MADFRNQSGREFIPIDSEEFREYRFACGATVRIESPLMLSVSASGGHRVFDGSGISHYIPSGWVHLSWRAKGGMPHFVA